MNRLLPGVLAAVLSCLSADVSAAAPPAKPSMPRLDRLGDPLPDGAVARVGSVRLRHAGLSAYAVSADGKTVVTSGSDGFFRTWDVASGRQTRAVRLQGDRRPKQLALLSHDGKTLAAYDRDELVFWEVESGKETKKLPAPKNVGFLALSPDGNTLAAYGGDGRASLWDWRAGKSREATLPRDNPRIGMDSATQGRFSPDGKWFVAAANAVEPLGVFDAATGREVHRLVCHAASSTISPDNKTLAVSSLRNDKGEREAVVRLFDLKSGTQTAQYPQKHEDAFFSISFSPDGRRLLCGTSERTCVLDARSGRPLVRLSDAAWWPVHSPDGEAIAAYSRGRLRFWDAVTGKDRHDFPDGIDSADLLAVSPDGHTLASSGWYFDAVRLWDARDGRPLRAIPLHGNDRHVRNLWFSHDGKAVTAAHYKGNIRSWQVEDGKELRPTQLNDPERLPLEANFFIYDFQPASRGKLVCTLERHAREGQPFTRLARWDREGKALGARLLRGLVSGVVWTPDGRSFARLEGGSLIVADAESGSERLHVRAPDLHALKATPDGRLLVAVGKSKDAVCWEAATGKEIARVPVGPGVAQFALASDGRTLVTTDADSFCVWDLATGEPIRRRALPMAGFDSWGRTPIDALALSPKGRRAFTSMSDGTALVWDLPRPPSGREVGPRQREAWWADLASDDARKAYAAVWGLAAAPERETLALFARLLPPVPDDDPKHVRRLIAELDSEEFDAREKANQRLEALGREAVPFLRESLEKKLSLEVRNRVARLLRAHAANRSLAPDELRDSRAVQVLERIGSPAARAQLDGLARGFGQALRTQEAAGARERMASR